MKTYAIKVLVLAVLSSALLARAQDSANAPEMPAPTAEHTWLQKYVGEWKSHTEITMDPTQPPMKGSGIERVRQLGGFWIIAEGSGQIEGMPGTMTYVLTLGYDPAKKAYVGTWVDSMTSTLWTYEGHVDASGKTLTLESEGPCPMQPGKIAKFREVSEFKDDNHRVHTSYMLGDDGKWAKLMTSASERVK